MDTLSFSKFCSLRAFFPNYDYQHKQHKILYLNLSPIPCVVKKKISISRIQSSDFFDIKSSDLNAFQLTHRLLSMCVIKYPLDLLNFNNNFCSKLHKHHRKPGKSSTHEASSKIFWKWEFKDNANFPWMFGSYLLHDDGS